MILVKKKSWNKLGEKYMLISSIKKSAKMQGLNIDLKIYPSRDVYYSYPSNIALIFQLADYKVVYGVIKLPQHIDLSKLDLRMHLDYSYSIILMVKEHGLKEIAAIEIYRAIRNLVIVKMILKKEVNNRTVLAALNDILGKDVAVQLKNNTDLIPYKRIGNIILDRIYKTTRKEVNELNNDSMVIANGKKRSNAHIANSIRKNSNP